MTPTASERPGGGGGGAADAEYLLVALDFMKARPVEEGGRRYVYCEASNEARDQQGERIMKAALLASRGLFLSNGNIDIDHLTMIGYRLGIQNPREFEIGLPSEVIDTPSGVLVKGEIYRGNDKADWWWKTQTEQTPAMKWFPSVGGKPTHKKRVFDPEAGAHTTLITKCDWKNLAFAREPQNLAVPAVSIMPYGEFAKGVVLGNAAICCNGGACECLTVKAVTAGAAVGPAGLTGGAALRKQSIDRGERGVFDASFGRAAARFMKSLADGALACRHRGGNAPGSLAELRRHFTECEDMPEDDAKKLAASVLTHVGQQLHKHAA